MINTVCDSIFWNDGPSCALEGYYRKMKKQNNEQSLFLLSPNPAKDIVTLNYKLEADKSAEFILYNNLSKPISTFQLSADAVELRINVSQLSAGCYFYKIQNANQSIGNGKFIIIK
nr:T9SS type A sorting domain-containing protein [Bacteroidota bacterium]